MISKKWFALSPLPLLAGCAQQPADKAALPWWAWLLIILAILLLLWLIIWLLTGRKCCLCRKAEKVKKPMATPKAEPEPVAVVKEEVVQAAVVETPPVVKAASLYDNLTLIEGIGPKISAILQGAGITTFAQLAELEPDKIKQVVIAGGVRLLDPTSWPRQAKLAAEGRMDELQALQDSLKGGKMA